MSDPNRKEYSYSEKPNDSDTISRQDAIDEAEQWIKIYSSGRGGQRERDAIKQVISGIKKLPSAQPERKKGKWIEKEDPYGFFNSIPVCSECGCTTKMRERYNFCPNCGADMRGKE